MAFKEDAMNAHTLSQIALAGITAEVIYRNIVRSHVRRYLGIEVH
jgi:hypothetical protein